MLYEEARVYLDHVSKYGSVLGLDSIKSLLGELGNPQKDLKFIHIAGTNGKGSILAGLSGILQQAGYRTGRYCSPTVMGYMERFQVDSQWMAEDELAPFVSQVKEAAEKVEEKTDLTVTVFEIETAIAFLYFREKQCDYVVLEAGMGGLLDATNVIDTTVLSIFASISMDHIGVLGNTLEEIAENKAGIIKPSCLAVVTSPQQMSVTDILRKKAGECGCRFVVSHPEKAVISEETMDGQIFSYGEYKDIRLRLAGRYQIDNAATVLEAVDALRRNGVSIPEDAVRKGFVKVTWPGRFQVLEKEPTVIADGAHNRDAARRLAENVRTYLTDRKIVGVMGVFKDKEYEQIAEIMAPYLSKVYTIDLPNGERNLGKERLCEVLRAKNVQSEPAENIADALEKAKAECGKEDVVLVFGSLSYLGEVIRLERETNVFERKKEERTLW